MTERAKQFHQFMLEQGKEKEFESEVSAQKRKKGKKRGKKKGLVLYPRDSIESNSQGLWLSKPQTESIS